MTNKESVKTNARINTLVEKLRIKLKKFAVLDRQGELIGEVEDLILDTQGQLNLVVSQQATAPHRVFLLMSKLVQKIDPPNKSVLVDMSKAESDNLPEYVMKEIPGMELSDISNSPVALAQEAADEGTPLKDSVGASVDFLQTPASELQNIQDKLNALESSDNREVLEEEIIRLLGERLIVDRSKRKVGEVIVRKEIETRMVQIPVRREKLIVEQVSPERKQLAEIDLGQEEVSGIELNEIASTDTQIASTPPASLDGTLTVRGVFNSPKIASLLLNAIALERRHGCKQVRLEIIVEDAERQKTYQEWVDRCSDSKQRQSKQ